MAMAHTLVNKHCYKAEQEHFSLSTVWTLILSLAPVVSALVKLKQGDTDPDLAWSQAWYSWVLQLLIQFRLCVYYTWERIILLLSLQIQQIIVVLTIIMILLLLLTTTTTTNASIVNNIPDCFNGKQ
jgi:hypothetical protein